MSSGESALFDDVMRESAEQWMSVVDECELAGFLIFPLKGSNWQLWPMSELVGSDH